MAQVVYRQIFFLRSLSMNSSAEQLSRLDRTDDGATRLKASDGHWKTRTKKYPSRLVMGNRFFADSRLTSDTHQPPHSPAPPFKSVLLFSFWHICEPTAGACGQTIVCPHALADGWATLRRNPSPQEAPLGFCRGAPGAVTRRIVYPTPPPDGGGGPGRISEIFIVPPPGLPTHHHAGYIRL